MRELPGRGRLRNIPIGSLLFGLGYRPRAKYPAMFGSSVGQETRDEIRYPVPTGRQGFSFSCSYISIVKRNAPFFPCGMEPELRSYVPIMYDLERRVHLVTVYDKSRSGTIMMYVCTTHCQTHPNPNAKTQNPPKSPQHPNHSSSSLSPPQSAAAKPPPLLALLLPVSSSRPASA